MNQQAAIGIDIGGTKISLALGIPNGNILAKMHLATRTGIRSALCVREMFQAAESLAHLARQKRLKLAGIGVGVPGAMNSRSGILPRSPHLPGWKNLPLRQLLQKKFRVSAYLANDANAAAVAESLFGSARGVSDFIYMTVSTGIGGGVFVHGKLAEGASYVGGEVGHTVVVPKGDRCRCGHRGCLEAYASGTAIAAYASREIRKGRKSKAVALIPKGEKLSAKILGLAVKKFKDGLALESYKRSGFYLGIGIANVINILNPSQVILGGGVLKSAPPIFWTEMVHSCRRHAWPEAFQAVKIIRSRLGDNVGDLGALALVFCGVRPS